MKTIVLDMEWTDTCTGGKYPQNSGKDILHNEVIQIGAVCIHETGTSIETGETFIVNVCPVVLGKVKKDVQKLTGLSYEELRKSGCRFKTAFQAFQTFIGNEPVRILTWDTQDQEVLEENMRFWHLNYENEPVFIDLQCLCGQYLFPGAERKSVENSLAALQMEPFGELHNALDDAVNEARIFARVSGAMNALTTYNPFCFVCGKVSDPQKFKIYMNLSRPQIFEIIHQDRICSMDMENVGQVIIPRFSHNGKYIKVWHCENIFMAEYTRISKDKTCVYAYVREITLTELDKIKNWHTIHKARKEEWLRRVHSDAR